MLRDCDLRKKEEERAELKGVEGKVERSRKELEELNKRIEEMCLIARVTKEGLANLV